MSKKNILLLLFIAVAVVAIFAFIVISDKTPQQQNQTNLDNGKEVDTNSWLTYRNEEYGFEVKYPEDYKVIAKDKYIRIYHPTYDQAPLVPTKGGSIAISISDVTLQEHINKQNSIDPPFSNVQIQSIYVLDEIEATKLSGGNAMGIGWTDIFAVYRDKNYIIHLNDIYYEEQLKILSTFRFIEK